MKKSLRITLIIATITSVISISGSYAATTYAINASNIGYTDNSSLGADNVQAAIDGTCSKVSTVLASKLDKNLIEITLPTPTKDTSSDYSLTYNIDLSEYTEIVPIIYVSNFWAYSANSYQIPPTSTGKFSSKLYSYSSNYGYYWDGAISITKKSIVVGTTSKSSNVNQNHFEIIRLYAR